MFQGNKNLFMMGLKFLEYLRLLEFQKKTYLAIYINFTWFVLGNSIAGNILEKILINLAYFTLLVIPAPLDF